MPKHKEHTFRLVEGVWRSITAGDSAIILADFLDYHELNIDECTQFARIICGKTTYVYRAYGGKITINIHEYV